jgi:hypothetical protein
MQPYELVKRQLQRAKKHIDRLEIELRAFHGTNPYTVRAEQIPESVALVFRVADVHDVPDDVTGTAADAIHNIRSTLDQLVYQLVEVNGGRPSRKRSAFPIADDADTFETMARERLRGVSGNAVDAIRRFTPYKSGNDTLWHLRELDDMDKHRKWLAVATIMSGIQFPTRRHILSPGVIAGTQKPTIVGKTISPPSITPAKKGDVLMGHVGPLLSHDVPRFSFEVAIDEPSIMPCQPIYPTLQRMFDQAGHIAYTLAPFLR